MSTHFDYDDDYGTAGVDSPGSDDSCEYYNNCDHNHPQPQQPPYGSIDDPYGYGYGYGYNETNVTGNGTWTLPSVAFMSVTSSILGLMILATIIGNVFVIVAVFKEKNLQSVANYLIVSLAVADLMVACLVMPMGALYSITGNNWILGPVLCDVWTSSDVLCCTASILHLVAIAVDRYWAVTDIEYIRSRNRSRINTMIFLVWLVAVVVSIAPILGWKDPEFYVRVEVERKCLVSQDVGYQIFATCATFYVPLCVILLLYWKIFQTARRRIRHRPGGAGSAGRPKAEKKVAIAEEISSTRVEGGNGSGEAASTIEQGEGAASRSSTSESHTHGPTTQSQLSPVKSANNNQNTKHHFHIQHQQIPPQLQSPTSPTTEDDDEEEEDVEAEGGGGKKSETIESLIDATTTPEEYGEDEEMIGLDDGDEIHISTIHKPHTATATSSFTTSPSLLPPNHSPANHMITKPPESPTINVIEASANSGGTGSPPAGSDPNNKAHGDGSGGGTIALETLSPTTLLSAQSSPSKMLKPSSTIKKGKSTKESIEVKRERKAAKTLAIITGAFVVCWLPFFVMALLMALCTPCWLPDWVVNSFLWLGYFNSTLNPIIYNVFSPEFRLAFKRILFGRNYGRGRRRAK